MSGIGPSLLGRRLSRHEVSTRHPALRPHAKTDIAAQGDALTQLRRRGRNLVLACQKEFECFDLTFAEF